MPRFAPCDNSRHPRLVPRRRQGSAPIRAATPFACLLLVSLLPAACSKTAGRVRDARDARRAAERYLADLAAHNPRTRQESTVPAPSASFVGGTVLRVDPPVSVAARMLRMEATAAREQADRAALELASAGEETADSLWRRSDDASRRERMLRAALAAAAGMTPDSTLRLCRMLVRTRWGGPLVGPERVDREYVLRAASAREGRWTVFSLLPRDRDPSGLPF